MAPSLTLPETDMETPPLVDMKTATPSLPTQTAQPITSPYIINEEPIRTGRPIRVVCMGAGYSGLMMAIVFNEKMQNTNAEFVIYERNKDLGGTWLENRYAMFSSAPLFHFSFS